MRVVALGGTGGMGRYAVKTAAGFDFVEEVIVADLDGEAARCFAAEAGGKVRGEALDVRDNERLRAVLSQGDVVLNTVGPFYRFGVPILRAAIECGKHYLDICDDWEPTLEMLDLHGEARRARVTAVIGLGASPGVTNILAVLAARELDCVEALYTVWDLDSAKPENIGPVVSAAMVHGILQLTGKIRVWQDGGHADVRPVRKVMIDYPCIGKRTTWSIGHPEGVTLPRTFPSLKVSRNLMMTSWTNAIALRVMGFFVNNGLLSLEKAARIAERVEGTGAGRTPLDFVEACGREKRVRLPPLFALAEGYRCGETASVAVAAMAAPAGGMGGATGVPLAAGLTIFNDGSPEPGVYAPEGVVDPSRFLSVLAPLCDPPPADVSDMILVTRSWEDVDIARSIGEKGKSGEDG